MTPRNLFSRRSALGLGVATLALAGCSLAPVYERPAAPVPTQWSGQSAPADAPVAPAASTLAWQQFVTDATLRTRIAQALAHNRDLRQTLLDVDAARALYRVQRADQLPGGELQASGNRQRLPADLSGSGQAGVQSSYQAGLGLMAFELDLFGRVRNLSQAALQEFLATEEAARAAQISLVAEVIHASLVWDSAQQRLALTERTLAARETSQQLVAHRRQAGAATALDAQEALTLTEQARADLERTRRELQQARHALDLLVGSGQEQPAAALAAAPVVQELAAGLPAELLAQRPDIRAAEHRLQARQAHIGAARAAFFPRITLTGALGSSSGELSELFASGQRSWSFLPQLSLPIFDGGRNRAALSLAEVRRDQAVAAYEQRIQTAFREVADALAATDTLRREEAARRRLAAASHEALVLSEARYRAGVDSHLRYLDAQRSDFAQQMAVIDVAAQRQMALATLFKALGGGWQAPAPR